MQLHNEPLSLILINDRNIPIEKVREIAKGRVYSGEMALEINLVDELGTLNDAILFAAQASDVKDYEVEHVIPPAPDANFTFPFDFINNFIEASEVKNLTAKDIYRNIRIYCIECEIAN